MATSTFGKKFHVPKKKANQFVGLMTSKKSPALPKGFQTRMVKANDIDELLKRALTLK